MEVKPTQRLLNIPISFKARVLRFSLNPISFHNRLNLESWGEKKIVLLKRFKGFAERWVFQFQERAKGQSSTNQFLVHVVKEGETLTLISKQYNVSVQEIAASNENIIDINLVLEGQHLKVPCFGIEADSTRMERCQSSLNILEGHENHKSFTMLSHHHVLQAKTTSYFFVLVPLIAICGSCIISAFRHNFSKNLKNQSVNESEGHHLRSKSIRWKSALRDIREPDVLHAESTQDSTAFLEDQSQVPFEDISNAYTTLEPAYEKFLSECGMSESGYWRGGSKE